MTLFIKLLSIIKKSIIIIISFITNSKNKNFYKSTFLFKLLDRLSFFKRYFSYWIYFRTVMKTVVYINLILTLFIIYLFTDYNSLTINLLAGIFLYQESEILNFIKRIIFNLYKYSRKFIQFPWLDELIIEAQTKIQKPVINQAINIEKEVTKTLNIPQDFDYKKYLLI